MWKIIFEIRTDESSKGYKQKNLIQNDKIMDKYAPKKRFHYDLRLQVYMYDLIYVYPETMTEED